MKISSREETTTVVTIIFAPGERVAFELEVEDIEDKLRELDNNPNDSDEFWFKYPLLGRIYNEI